MFITITSSRGDKAFTVKAAEHRVALRAMYRALRTQAVNVKEARRQLGKMVQFGLYNSEKTVTDLTVSAAASQVA